MANSLSSLFYTAIEVIHTFAKVQVRNLKFLFRYV